MSDGATGAGNVKRYLRPLSLFFFYAYVLTVIAAGAEGIFGARLDFPVFMHQPLGQLAAGGVRDVLSQYRFLRGLELGFGIFALRLRKEIYTQRVLNRLFLIIMGLGILGRLVGIAIDGLPSLLMQSFLYIEAVGIVIIALDTRAATAS